MAFIIGHTNAVPEILAADVAGKFSESCSADIYPASTIFTAVVCLNHSRHTCLVNGYPVPAVSTTAICLNLHQFCLLDVNPAVTIFNALVLLDI